MGTTLYGKDGQKLDLNVYQGDTLAWLAWGLQSNYGVYAPLCSRDCHIIARILRHKARLFEMWEEDKNHNIQEAFNLYMYVNRRKDYLGSKKTVKWMRDVADFFDSCGSLVTEEYFNKKGGGA